MPTSKLIKSIFTAIVSAILAISSVSPAAAADTVLPVIDPASPVLSATTAKAGDTITATYRITDDTDCCDYHQAWLYTPAGTVGQQVSPTRKSGDGLDGTYTAIFTVPVNAAGGTWTMKAQATDKAGNYTHLQLLGSVTVDAPVEVCGDYRAPAPVVGIKNVSGYYGSTGTYSFTWSPVTSAVAACTIVGYRVTFPNGTTSETASTSSTGSFAVPASSSATFLIQAKTNSGVFGNAASVQATRLASNYFAIPVPTPYISVSATNGSSISATWSYSPGTMFGGYIARLTNTYGTILQTKTLGTNETSTTFTGLSSGVAYYIRLTPLTIDSKEYTYNVGTGYATTLSGTPVVSSTVGLNTAKLTWTVPSWLQVARYSLVVNGVSRNLSSPTATSLDLTGLTPGSSNSYTLTAFDASGVSYQRAGTFVTASIATPTVVLDSSTLTGYGVKLNYSIGESADYKVTGVTVSYSLNNSSWTIAGTGTSASGSVNLSGLPHGSTIYYRVVGTTDVGIATPERKSSFTTLTVPNPTTSVSGVTGDAATASWSMPAWVNVNSISLQLSTNRGASWVVAKTSTSTTGTFGLSALKPGTAYQVRTVATLSDGQTRTSTASFSTTSVTPPSVSVTSITGVEASVSYSVSSFANSTGISVALYNYSNATWTDVANSTSLSGTATASNLTPGTGYLFRVTAKLADGTSMYSEKQFTTTAVTAPVISVSNVNSSGAAISWTLPVWSSPTAMTIQVSTNSGASWINVGTANGVSGSVNVTGLKSATYHQIRITGTVNGKAVTSSTAAFNTTSIPNPTVALSGLTGNNATVNWSLPSGVDVKGVSILLGLGGIYTSTGTSTSASGSYSFDGLKYGTTYTARVVIELPDGTLKTSTLSFTTVALPNPTITISGVGATSGTVKWSLPAWVSVKEVDVQTYTNGSWVSVSKSVEVSGSLTITGLKLGSSTAVRLSITYDDGSTRIASAPNITTTNPPTVYISSAYANGWDEIVMKWSYSFSDLDKFQIRWSADGGNTYSTPVSVEAALASNYQYTIADLKENTRYRISLDAVYSDGSIKSAIRDVTTQVRPKVAPAQPEIATFEASGRSATITWTQPEKKDAEEVTNWEVKVRASDSPYWRSVSTIENVDGVELKLNISDLNPGRTYFAQVIAKTQLGLIAASATKVILIKFPMGTPGSLNSYKATFNGGVFEWYQPSGSVNEQPKSYRLEFGPRDTEDFTISKIVEAGSARMSYVISDLKSGTTYKWRVVAVGEGTDNEMASGIRYFSTLTAMKAPTNMYIPQWGDTWAKIAWTQLNNLAYKKVAKFEIRVSKDEGATWETLEAQTDSSTRLVTVEDLSPETEYEVRVVAISAEGDEAFSQIKVTTKQNLEAITEAKVSLTTARSAVILWDLPEEPAVAESIDKVTVQVQQKGKWVSWASTSNPAAERLSLKGLKPKTTYTYRIVTIGDDGYSEFSVVKKFRTTN